MIIKDKKLQTSTRWSYGLATCGYYVTMTLYTVYPMVFMTNCLGIPVVTAASIISIAEIFDFLLSFFLSSIIVNTRLKWGKYRSWFLIAPIIASLSTIMFYSPLLTKIPSHYVLPVGIFLYLAWNVASTIILICHGSLNNVLTRNLQERVRLRKLANQLKAIIGAVFGYIMMPIVYLVGNSKTINLKGMVSIGILYSILYFICFYVFFLDLKKYDFSNEVIKEKASLIQTVKLLFTDMKMASLTIAATLAASAEIIYSLLASYFFLYVLHTIDILNTFNWTSKIFAFVGSTIAFYVTRHLSKKNSFIFSYGLQAFMLFVAYFTINTPYITLFAICIGILGQEIAQCLVIPMYSDIADSIKRRTRKNVLSSVMTANSLIYKVAGFVGSLSLYGLAKIGFVAGVKPSAEIVEGIRTISIIWPLTFCIASLIVILLYYKE